MYNVFFRKMVVRRSVFPIQCVSIIAGVINRTILEGHLYQENIRLEGKKISSYSFRPFMLKHSLNCI